MPPAPEVPEVVIRRLPYYLRSLVHMANRGQQVVSSQELGEWLGVSPAQIRKDLSYFGEFGRQGLGYEVAYLRDQLCAILQSDKHWRLALVGAGALGHALIHYPDFAQWNYHIVAVFDNDPAKHGQRLREDLVVQPMEELEETIRREGIQMAIIAVPPVAAQEVADLLVAAGVRSLLNYAPISLVLPEGVYTEEIDPVARLQSMSYYLR